MLHKGRWEGIHVNTGKSLQAWLGEIGDPGAEHKGQNRVAQGVPSDIVLFLHLGKLST